MSDALEILGQATSLLMVDWPSEDVPESLVRAGYIVFVKGGPGPRDYAVRELRDGAPVSRPLGRRPDAADIVYAYRPVPELPGIVEVAREMGARALWWQAGPAGAEADDWQRAREIAEDAGLAFVGDVNIADAALELGRQ